LSAVANIDYVNSYGGIKRKNVKRVITIGSNVLTGFTANDINNQIVKAIPDFKLKEGV